MLYVMLYVVLYVMLYVISYICYVAFTPISRYIVNYFRNEETEA